MILVQTIAECRAERSKLARLALVPTMGALHDGHLSLIREAKKLAPHVAVSIFVNPTQFGPREDFNKYPRPIMADLEKCKTAGADLVFNPGVDEIYRPGAADVVVDVPSLTSVLEGKHRPGHFKGVCQVVAKLFNIVRPDVAVFGEKDFQQLRVLQAMAEGLDFSVEVVGAATIRESDGLAMSSRNQYLSPDERQRALSISRALFLAQGECKAGVRQTNRLLTTMQHVLLDKGTLGRVPVAIDYVAAVDPVTLKNVDTITGPTVLAVAVRVGATRLIDNVVVRPE